MLDFNTFMAQVRQYIRRPLRKPHFLPDALRKAQHLLDMPNLNVAPNPPKLPFWLHNELTIDYLITTKKAELSPFDIQMMFNEYYDNNIDSTFYFTDGSAEKNQVGSAAIGPDFSFKERLSDCCTVFSAEVYAIYRVMIHIKQKHVQQSVICTDSKSTLQALKRTDEVDHPGIFNIHKLVLSLEHDQHVTFLWIPGHSGISGNERADSLAKAGAKLAAPIPEPVALGDILHLTKLRFSSYLQDQWDQNHAEHLYRIKPKLGFWESSNQQSRKKETTLSRLRMGHTRLTHYHLFHRADPPSCETCNVRLSVEHILIRCPALRIERNQIINYLRIHDRTLDLATLLGNPGSNLTDMVLDFVLNSPFSGRI